MYQTKFTFGVETDLDLQSARSKVEELLKEEGFGVLTEIDVKEPLKKKIDVDFRPYVILGACNPQIAHQALQKELEIGAVLPCNVIVYENDKGGSSVSFMDPKAALGIVGEPGLEEFAAQVTERLKRVAEKI
jgi:uncharacterized protein (DUF302 family)